MTIFEQTFSAGETIRAADMTMTGLQNWMKRGLVIGHRAGDHDAIIQGGGSPGRHRRFTWFNVMEIALAQALTQIGFNDLPRAFQAARLVAHTGGGPLFGNPERHPGFPFPPEHGRTFLAVAGDLSGVALWKPGTDPIAVIRQGLGNPEGFVLIDVLAIFDRICGALGLHPSEILEQVYGSTR